MSGESELRVSCRAAPEAARPLRHALAAFLNVFRFDPDWRDDVLTAAGEALANAIEHAYDGTEPGELELFARFEHGGTLSIDVADDGRFVEHEPRPGRGYGLRIVKAIAPGTVVETSNGTRVHMVFDSCPASAR